MTSRTYKPHIRVQIGPRWNSLIGWIDFSAILKGTDWRWWECEGSGARGDGKTPKEAYDAWYRDLLRPYQNGKAFMDAYRNANTPQFPQPAGESK